MKKIISVFTSLSACILLASCDPVPSTDLKETTPFYQAYDVAYDKNNNEIIAAGLFRTNNKNEAPIQLTGGASLLINGGDATYNNLTNRHYKIISGLADISFVLKKNNGTTYTNNIKTADINKIQVDFPSTFPASIAKSSGFDFEWTGPAIQNGQMISLDLSGKDNAGSTISVSGTVSANKVFITADKLKDFKTGEVITFSFRRSYSTELEQGDQSAGGERYISYSVKKEALLN